MAINNQELRYKIEIEDIQSYVLRIPVSITANFIVNEVVNGDDSGASAVVVENTALIDGYIKIRNRSGFFYTLEGLTGSVSGLASKTGETEDTSELYDNVGLGISGGLWTLLSDEDLLTDIRNPNSKINILDGGGLSSGDSFGFNVTNQTLSTIIQQDGLYFRGRKVMFYIGLVNIGVTTWYQWWTGVVETIRATSELEVEFSCADLVTQIKEKVGSKEIPICLNKNFNCKLVSDEEIKSIYTAKVGFNYDTVDSVVLNTDDSKNKIRIQVYSSGEWETKLTDGTQTYIEVSLGAGSGKIFKVYSIEKITNGVDFNDYWVYVNEDVSELNSVFEQNQGSTENLSIIRLVSYLNTYTLSQKEVQKIHDTLSSFNEKTLTVSQEDFDFNLSSPEDYEGSINAEGVQKVDVTSVSEGNSIRSFSIVPVVNTFIEDYWYAPGTAEFKIDAILPAVSISDMNDIAEKKQKLIFFMEKLLLEGFNDLPSLATVNIKISGLVRSVVVAGSRSLTLVDTSIELSSIHFNQIGIDTEVILGDLILEDISTFTMNDFLNADALSTFKIEIEVLTNAGSATQPTAYTPINYGFKYGGDLRGDISIGCDGENVQPGNEIETVTDTIDYMLTEYYDKTAGDIDSASFAQAELDFNIFPNNPVRNLAHQIIQQNQGNALLSDMLITQHLCMYPGQDGKFRLENWLPKSIVFSQSSTDIDYTETGANRFTYLSPIIEGDVTKIYSDMELNFNFNESTGNYDNTVRIKRTDLSTFDFDLCTEGIDISEYQQAFSCWQSLKAGRNRINRDSQTVIENKYIKTDFSDGTGTSEALSFILGLSGFRNRAVPFGKVHVPINPTNLSNELLSFVGIEDQFITDGILRKSWIVERELNIEESRIEYKIAYDIHPFDIFIYRVNVWSDGNNPGNVKSDGNNPSNVKTNGLGV